MLLYMCNSLCVYIYIYICIYLFIHTHISGAPTGRARGWSEGAAGPSLLHGPTITMIVLLLVSSIINY